MSAGSNLIYLSDSVNFGGGLFNYKNIVLILAKPMKILKVLFHHNLFFYPCVVVDRSYRTCHLSVDCRCSSDECNVEIDATSVLRVL